MSRLLDAFVPIDLHCFFSHFQTSMETLDTVAHHPIAESPLGHLDEPVSSTETFLENVETEGKPPLKPLVKVTVFRLMYTYTILVFGLVKAVMAYRGSNTIPTTIEWISGVVFAVGFYWLGLMENVQPPVASWFFHQDYSRQVIFLPLFLLCQFWVIFVKTTLAFMPWRFIGSGCNTIPLPFYPITSINPWIGLVLLIPVFGGLAIESAMSEAFVLFRVPYILLCVSEQMVGIEETPDDALHVIPAILGLLSAFYCVIRPIEDTASS